MIATIEPESLGNPDFRRDYGLRHAYLAGAMYKGIASAELVIALGKAGLMGFLGTGGLDLQTIEKAILEIQRQLGSGQAYGMNLLCNMEQPDMEDRTVELYLKHGVRFIEASAFAQVTPSVVRYRLKGLTRNFGGEVLAKQTVLAKVSRPEVAAAFMQPAPANIVKQLVAGGQITQAEAELSQHVPVASEICVEADSGGHTDQGVAYALMPAMFALREEMQTKFRYARPIRIGAAGGIGTPASAAAAFVMGSDFILTGSINQCTVEAGTSEAVKNLLQELNVQDTAYAPAGDMFEMGSKVQVARRGLFFPARANKLYELYQRHDSIDDIDAKTRQQIEEKYFRRSFEEVWGETQAHWARTHPAKIAEAQKNPKQKMALIFKWYFVHSRRLAMQGSQEQRVDYQIHCGPALGAFNQWVKGSDLQPWRNRRVADIGIRIMLGTAELLTKRLGDMLALGKSGAATTRTSARTEWSSLAHQPCT